MHYNVEGMEVAVIVRPLLRTSIQNLRVRHGDSHEECSILRGSHLDTSLPIKRWFYETLRSSFDDKSSHATRRELTPERDWHRLW